MEVMRSLGFATFILALFLFISVPCFHIISYAQSIQSVSDKVDYDLPYPGILPDNPLYYVKVARDRIVEFATRDNVKKARLYLLLSDKRIATAQELAKKGKTKLAITTLQKAEKYSLKVPSLLVTASQQGVGAPEDLKQKLILSNQKHAEVIDSIGRDMPQGELNSIKQVADLNRQVAHDLKAVK